MSDLGAIREAFRTIVRQAIVGYVARTMSLEHAVDRIEGGYAYASNAELQDAYLRINLSANCMVAAHKGLITEQEASEFLGISVESFRESSVLFDQQITTNLQQYKDYLRDGSNDPSTDSHLN
jgi:hypothetical protein